MFNPTKESFGKKRLKFNSMCLEGVDYKVSSGSVSSVTAQSRWIWKCQGYFYGV